MGVATMGRPKGRPKSDRQDRTAKIDTVVLSRAEMIARAQGITLAEYLSEALRPVVAKDFAKVMKAMEEGREP